MEEITARLLLLGPMSGFLLVLGKLFWLPVPITIGLWAWCHWIAYPLFLEARIRSGKSWLYLPHWWKPKYRPFVQLFHMILVLSASASLAATVFHFLSLRHVPPFANAIGASLSVAALATLYYLQRHWIALRYHQQQEGYFLIYRRIARLYHETGKPFNDTDIRNRCKYEHQNTLRRADQRGRLLRYLDLLGRVGRKGPDTNDLADAST